LAAGVTRAVMCVSQMLVNTCALVLMNSVIATFGFGILDIHIPAGNEIYLALMIILTVLSAQYLGFFIASVFEIQHFAFLMAAAIYIGLGFLCGKSILGYLMGNCIIHRMFFLVY
jgi:hypothetical protein